MWGLPCCVPWPGTCLSGGPTDTQNQKHFPPGNNEGLNREPKGEAHFRYTNLFWPSYPPTHPPASRRPNTKHNPDHGTVPFKHKPGGTHATPTAKHSPGGWSWTYLSFVMQNDHSGCPIPGDNRRGCASPLFQGNCQRKRYHLPGLMVKLTLNAPQQKVTASWMPSPALMCSPSSSHSSSHKTCRPALSHTHSTRAHAPPPRSTAAMQGGVAPGNPQVPGGTPGHYCAHQLPQHRCLQEHADGPRAALG